MHRIASLFQRDDSGGTAIEYSMIAAIISISIVIAVDTIGSGFLYGVLAAIVTGFTMLFGG